MTVFLDFRVNGKRHREFIGVTYRASNREERREALQLVEKIRMKRQLELQSGEHGFEAPFRRDADFVEYFASFLPKKPKQWRTVHLHLKDFADGECVPFKAIDEAWIERFQDFLIERVTGNTAITYMAKIRAALNLAIRARIITRNPCEFVKPPKRGPVKRPFLTLEELQKLADTPCPDTEVKRAFLFACYTGLRWIDMKRLTWKNIKDGTGGERRIEIVQSKTGEPLTVKLPESAIQFLGTRKAPESSAFNIPEYHIDTWLAMADWCDRAKIGKRVGFHAARRTYATLLLAYGEQLVTVSRLLGHTELRHTQIYIRMMESMMDKAVTSLPKINVKPSDESEKRQVRTRKGKQAA
jgi:integrase